MANRYEQLVIWQLADELRVQVFGFTERRPLARDFKRRGQLDDAIDSVCRNIAEGFGTRSDPMFARYLQTSFASLNEVKDGLRSARLKGYISIDELNTAMQLANRLRPALENFIAHLQRKPRRRPRTHKRKRRADGR